MKLFPYLSYLSTKLRYPKHSDFLEEGLGIEARAKRARKYWQKHLHACFQFQREAFKELHGERVVVLGAGRLLDLDYRGLASHFKEFALYDADPGVFPFWSKAEAALNKQNCAVTKHFCDITGQVIPWTDALDEFLTAENTTSLGKLNTFLIHLPETHRGKVELGSADAIISLNLLSQIPVLWKERFLKLLHRHRIIKEVDEELLPAELRETLDKLCQTLQLKHLELLAAGRARKTVLLTDIYFHYYQKELSHWRTENALYFKSGMEEGKPSRAENLSLYDSWLWHLAPEGIEEKDYGVIHEVRALAFSESARITQLWTEA